MWVNYVCLLDYAANSPLSPISQLKLRGLSDNHLLWHEVVLQDWTDQGKLVSMLTSVDIAATQHTDVFDITSFHVFNSNSGHILHISLSVCMNGFNKALVIAVPCALQHSHLVDLLLVQVKDLSRRGGSDLLISPVARLRAVPTVPGQHKYHLGTKGAGELRGLLPFTVCFLQTRFHLAPKWR